MTGALRAVKVVWREDFEDERTFEREFEGILKFEPMSRDHPALVNILHVGRSPDGVSFYYYVMELGDDVTSGQDINPIEYEPRTLRAERCTFKAHRETKQGPVYDLVIARGGPKMKEAAADEVSGADGGSTPKTQQLTVRAETMETVGSFLSGDAGRKIVDKTGLGGKKFDYKIEWTPDRAQTTDDPGVSIFTAIEEQLGLRLVPSKGPIDTLVIDHMERPTPN